MPLGTAGTSSAVTLTSGARAFCIIARPQTAGDELGLHSAAVHLIAQGLLHEAGQAFAFVKHGFGRLAQCGFNAQRWQWPFSWQVLMRCICDAYGSAAIGARQRTG